MIVPTDAIGGWRFCHPLIHDAAYRSLLATDRRDLHTRVADRLEARQPAGPIGAIARHRAAAGDARAGDPAPRPGRRAGGRLGARRPRRPATRDGGRRSSRDPDGRRRAATARHRGTRHGAGRRRPARGDRSRRPSGRRRGQTGLRRQRGRHAGSARRLAAGPWPTSIRRPGRPADRAGPRRAGAVDPRPQLGPEVDEHDAPATPARSAIVDRLLGRQVAAPRVVELGARQGRLGDEEVGAAGGLDERRRSGPCRRVIAIARPVGSVTTQPHAGT